MTPLKILVKLMLKFFQTKPGDIQVLQIGTLLSRAAREFDLKHRACAYLALRGDCAAMHLRDPTRDCQSQARSAAVPRPRAVHAIKPVENVLQFRFGNAHAGVAY